MEISIKRQTPKINQKEVMMLKSTITARKNSLGGFKGRPEQAGRRSSSQSN